MFFRYTNSLQHSAAAMYSASVVDYAIIGCIFEHQLIGPPAKNIIYPVVYFFWCLCLPRSLHQN